MSSKLKLGIFATYTVAMLLVVFAFWRPAGEADETLSTLELNEIASAEFRLEISEMSAEDFRNASFQVVPEMLAVIYRAFAQIQDEQIYDGLAQVSAGEALETLYLERTGAMVGGGLDEADQELHAMELAGLSSLLDGTTFRMNVKWRVVGTAGRATHLHVQGNTYTADLTIEPVEGVWRMTSFDLTDVDRTDNGTLVAGD